MGNTLMRHCVIAQMGCLRGLTEIQVQTEWEVASHSARDKNSVECSCHCLPSDNMVTSSTSPRSPLSVPTATVVQGLSCRSNLSVHGHCKKERVLHHPISSKPDLKVKSSASCHPTMAKVNNKTNTHYKVSMTSVV